MWMWYTAMLYLSNSIHINHETLLAMAVLLLVTELINSPNLLLDLVLNAQKWLYKILVIARTMCRVLTGVSFAEQFRKEEAWKSFFYAKILRRNRHCEVTYNFRGVCCHCLLWHPRSSQCCQCADQRPASSCYPLPTIPEAARKLEKLKLQPRMSFIFYLWILSMSIT